MISVCMATCNGEKYLREQISSILAQISREDELIISDDESVDNTIRIINGFNDTRIKLIKHISTGYYTSNFENALLHCKGDYIFLADQDDVWIGNKVSTCMMLLKTYDFVMTNASITDKDLNILVDSRNEFYNIKTGFIQNFLKSRYLGCCMAFNRRVLDFALPFPHNHDLCHHDSWISLIAEMKFKCIVDDSPLLLYRRHLTNTSSGGDKSSRIDRIITIRFYLIYWLIRRRIERAISGYAQNEKSSCDAIDV